MGGLRVRTWFTDGALTRKDLDEEKIETEGFASSDNMGRQSG